MDIIDEHDEVFVFRPTRSQALAQLYHVTRSQPGCTVACRVKSDGHATGRLRGTRVLTVDLHSEHALVVDEFSNWKRCALLALKRFSELADRLSSSLVESARRYRARVNQGALSWTNAAPLFFHNGLHVLCLFVFPPALLFV